MRLYEVQATEYNGEQEYSQSKLLAAENIDQAWQIARDYFRQWYDDGDEPEKHNTDNLDEFEFLNGCIILRIKGLGETTLDEWMRTRIVLHSIGALPESLIETALTKAATCAVKDSCPKCGAGCDERELTDKDFIGIEAIHMHYICKKCGSQITEEFTLTDVFIDNGQ